MKHYILFGEKLGHSLSVPIHEAVFRRLGLDADYKLCELPRDTFARQADEILKTVDGVNITIPYKQDIMPLCDEIDPAALAVGAVNTVVVTDKRRGYNTDVAGFTAMLRYHGIDPAGKPCYVLGTGGASKAIRVALAQMGAANVTNVSRTPREGMIGYDRLAEEFSGILVNCTPAGMYPNNEGCPIPEKYLTSVMARAEGVADTIYNPAETVLTAAARKAGVPACTGLYMLIAQAMEAERLWQGYPMPEDLNEQLMKELKI